MRQCDICSSCRFEKSEIHPATIAQIKPSSGDPSWLNWLEAKLRRRLLVPRAARFWFAFKCFRGRWGCGIEDKANAFPIISLGLLRL